jgi:23S rRNA-/tRNA-specific pseudouridylate synthase
LRVHLAHNGTHILGDEKYGLGTPPDRLPDGLMLHALRLSWPGLKKPLMAPIPPDFAKAMEILGLSFTAGNDPFEGMD